MNKKDKRNFSIQRLNEVANFKNQKDQYKFLDTLQIGRLDCEEVEILKQNVKLMDEIDDNNFKNALLKTIAKRL